MLQFSDVFRTEVSGLLCCYIAFSVTCNRGSVTRMSLLSLCSSSFSTTRPKSQSTKVIPQEGLRQGHEDQAPNDEVPHSTVTRDHTFPTSISL